MSRSRLALIVGVSTVLLTVVGGSVLGLATNFVSELPRLPGFLDLIRTHPLRVLVGAGVGLGVLAVVTLVLGTSGPRQASQDDVDGLHDRFDELKVRAGAEDGMERLPPHARELLSRADPAIRDRVWQLVAPFADVVVDSRVLARSGRRNRRPFLMSIP